MADRHRSFAASALSLPHAPPAAPWQEIVDSDSGGYASFYYSEDLSPLPIRWITKPRDNKSDPNLETQTYGLFSVCGQKMRSAIVRSGCPHVFFITRRDRKRRLAGYYHMKWFAEVPSACRDFRLAADFIMFLQQPIAVADVDLACGTHLSDRFRMTLKLTRKECGALRRLLIGQPDGTADLLREIDRVERLAASRSGGYRYPSWGRRAGFTWEAAAQYLLAEAGIATAGVKNATPSSQWQCTQCGWMLNNQSRLRQCASCQSIGTLEPILGG